MEVQQKLNDANSINEKLNTTVKIVSIDVAPKYLFPDEVEVEVSLHDCTAPLTTLEQSKPAVFSSHTVHEVHSSPFMDAAQEQPTDSFE